MNDFKQCSVCGQFKPYTDFAVQRTRFKALRKTYCMKCDYAKRKARLALLTPDPISANDDPLTICQAEFPLVFPLVKRLLESYQNGPASHATDSNSSDRLSNSST